MNSQIRLRWLSLVPRQRRINVWLQLTLLLSDSLRFITAAHSHPHYCTANIIAPAHRQVSTYWSVNHITSKPFIWRCSWQLRVPNATWGGTVEISKKFDSMRPPLYSMITAILKELLQIDAPNYDTLQLIREHRTDRQLTWGMTRISEKMMEASSSNLLIGWSVTSQANSGVWHIVKKSWCVRNSRNSGK